MCLCVCMFVIADNGVCGYMCVCVCVCTRIFVNVC